MALKANKKRQQQQQQQQEGYLSFYKSILPAGICERRGEGEIVSFSSPSAPFRFFLPGTRTWEKEKKESGGEKEEEGEEEKKG